MDAYPLNDSLTWNSVAQQLSAFHNIATNIKNSDLRRCYCAKLHSFVLRVRNLFQDIDDYKFFYGIENYTGKSSEKLLVEAKANICQVSVNALLCYIQFLLIFYGSRDFNWNDNEVDNILRPVYYGVGNLKIDYTTAEINQMSQPFKNIHLYIREWTEGVKKFQSRKEATLARKQK